MDVTSRLPALLTALAIVALGATVRADGEPRPEGTRDPVVASVLRAIDRMVKNPIVDQVRPEYPQVFNFAERSDQVLVTISTRYLEFSGDKKLDSALIAYFIAGAVKFDLENPEAREDELADIPAAIRSALVYYRAHRSHHPERSHPFFERMDEHDRAGTLDQYVAEAAKRAD